ncbi:MAG TPA: CSLREA domain-containing protein, partial [Blastocatellia bacterium]|nr:CSLREA domain-containing protein [Blastocatellia bacterium]
MKALRSLTRPLVFGASALSRAALIGAAVWLAAGSLPATARAQIVVNSPEDIFVLTMPGQPPPCTLRDAILAANRNRAVAGCAAGVSSASPDTISFNLSFGMSRIRVRDQLPPITEPVIINGGSGGPISLGPERVELDGTLASQAASLRGERAHGLYLAAGDSTIRNLVINNFNGNGIVMTTLSGPPPGDFTPPTITDPSLPEPIPCHARPREPECP